MDDDSDRGRAAGPAPVVLANPREVGRAVARSLWWLWAIPLAIVLLLLVVSGVSSRVEANGRADDVAREKQVRASAKPLTGDGWQIDGLYCVKGGDDAVVSGQIKNTTDRPNNLYVKARVLDAAGTLIGQGGDSISDVGPGGVANWRVRVPLVRFADGPPTDQCLVEGGGTRPTSSSTPSLDQLLDLTTTTTRP